MSTPTASDSSIVPSPSLNGEPVKPATADSVIDNVKQDKKAPGLIDKWLRHTSDSFRFIILSLFIVVGLLLTVTAIYLCFFKWLPDLWKWGFEPLSWKCILSVMGILGLFIVPFIPFIILGHHISDIIELNAQEQEREFNEKLKQIEDTKNGYERQLLKTDQEGLIPLVTYSRLELESYYKIGLKQAQRSYTYSIISMWIGFTIIISGIVLYVVPIFQINPLFAKDNSLKVITLASGVITEMIAALFLWIYKSSISQITYFYNRQLFIHNSLLAFTISKTMDNSDEAKKIIIKKIMAVNVIKHKLGYKKGTDVTSKSMNGSK